MSSIHSLLEWKPLDKLEAISWALEIGKSKKESTRRGLAWVNDGSISPLELYCYLKHRFGEPNGILMEVKAPTVDNLIHWHYMISSSGRIIQFVGLSFRTEIHVSLGEGEADTELDILVDALRNDIKAHRSHYSEIKSTFEKWSLLINPYFRINKIVDTYIARLKELHVEDVVIPTRPRSPEDAANVQVSMKKCWDLYHEANALGTSIKLMLPVLGEAFVNLLIFVLGKKELKDDRRIYDDFLRRNIDVRIKSLHLHCVGFARAIDSSAAEFKSFHTLMNTRNDNLHGNINFPSKPERFMYFDHHNIPLIEEETTMNEFVLSHALRQIEPNTLYEEHRVVSMFVKYVQTFLDEKAAAAIGQFLVSEQIGWDDKRKIAGTILPQTPAEIWSY